MCVEKTTLYNLRTILESWELCFDRFINAVMMVQVIYFTEYRRIPANNNFNLGFDMKHYKLHKLQTLTQV